VDDADIENGCMEVISGSHRDGIATHGTSESTDNLLSIHQEIPDDLVDSSQAVPIELTAGQASIHDGQLFHASRPNRSDRRRCGLTVRFIPPAARQVEKNSTGQQWLPILVRGEDPYHHYPETPAPFPFPGS
jgi:ectoine hydroxylase-related dioxygenase (phytanoyl-CoA dioxygenase family)